MPVISLEGAMGVLLYGMAAVVGVDGMSEVRRWLLAERDERTEKCDSYSSRELTREYAVRCGPRVESRSEVG